jgi:rsbT co-antagonist protein RsbR
LSKNLLSEILLGHENDLLTEWLQLQRQALGGGRERFPESQAKTQSHDFLVALRDAVGAGADSDLADARWARMRELLGDLSRQRAVQGLSATDTATFVFSFKQALFNRLQQEYGKNPEVLIGLTWQGTELLDKLGLYTTEVFLKSREDMIARQQAGDAGDFDPGGGTLGRDSRSPADRNFG